MVLASLAGDESAVRFLSRDGGERLVNSGQLIGRQSSDRGSGRSGESKLDRVLNEMNRAIGEQKVAAATVIAAEATGSIGAAIDRAEALAQLREVRRVVFIHHRMRHKLAIERVARAAANRRDVETLTRERGNIWLACRPSVGREHLAVARCRGELSGKLASHFGRSPGIRSQFP